MNEQKMAYPYNGILFYNSAKKKKKEWTADTYNMDEQWKHDAKWKKRPQVVKINTQNTQMHRQKTADFRGWRMGRKGGLNGYKISF